MIAPTQIKKPKNWQDFEMLCKKLWGEVWDCSDTIKRNGRSGQKQCGVDVYGVPKGENQYYGIQCKGKDDYSNSVLTTAEIDSEIKKAKEFKPALKQFIFTTTANKDVSIEEYVRQKDIENRRNGLFEVCLFCWEDIVDLLEERRNTYNWYVNNCQYKDCTDIEISFVGEKEVKIHPQYIREITKYSLISKPSFNYEALNPRIDVIKMPTIDLFHTKHKVDYRWCKVPIRIENIGSTTIKDYKLYFSIDGDCIEELSTGIHYVNDFILGDAARAEINHRIKEEQEVIYSKEYINELIYIPKDPILVQTDRRLFEFEVKPKDCCTSMQLHWDFKSQDYCKQGVLNIIIEPQYEEKINNIEVYDVSKMKDTVINIYPKIIEE